MECINEIVFKWSIISLIIICSGCESTVKKHKPYPIWEETKQWQVFKSCFIEDDGRVVDSFSKISHSEGQGYAMIIATAVNDRFAFDSLWYWTKQNLQVREDKLFAWKWQKNTPHVPDQNNASDGDLLIAWALMRAAKRWSIPNYEKLAIEILRSLKEKAIINKVKPLLIPGTYGFKHSNTYTLNLSYYVYPALNDAAMLDPAGPWSSLIASGFEFSSMALQELNLLPDWSVYQNYDKRLTHPLDKHQRFGYEAIRIPIYACWINQCHNNFTALVDKWSSTDHPPAWLSTNSQANYRLSSGAMAVRDLLLKKGINKDHKLTSCDSTSSYYSSILSLLAQLAQYESKLFVK